MTVLGVVVKSGAKPSLACVVLRGAADQPVVAERFDIKSPETLLVDQVEQLARALGSKIEGLDVNAVVIRSADFPPRPSRSSASDKRCMIEGALIYVARMHGAVVEVRTGKDVGDSLNLPKAQAEDRGRELDSRRPEAAAAALSGL